MHHERIVFLDVDGVLNHREAFKRWWPTWGTDTLDPECLRALAWLCRDGAEIVLTSTWRLYPDADRTIRIVLHALGLDVIDETPDLSLNDPHSARGAEISAWLAEHPTSSYVVLDDSADAGDGHAGRFVQTEESGGGLTWEKAREARAILFGESAVGA